MSDVDKFIDDLNGSDQLIDIIDGYQKNTTTDCDNNCDISISESHEKATDNITPLCPDSVIGLLIKVISKKPNLLDDDVRAKVVKVFKEKNIKVRNMISVEHLTTLHASGSQIISWIKYESLLNLLIKEEIYDPKSMASEVLSIVREELNPAIACKLASVIEGCVKHCRESSRGKSDDELDEKWCEIIDWMSWFLASKDDDFI